MARPTPRTFTLVELMIVIAIVAALAALAIPALVDHQRRAQASEAVVNRDAMMDAVRAYRAEEPDAAVETGWHPRAQNQVDRTLVPWDHAATFGELGIDLDGAVRCTYLVRSGSSGIPATTFDVSVNCDFDGDSYFANWESATFLSNSVRVAGLACLPVGVPQPKCGVGAPDLPDDPDDNGDPPTAPPPVITYATMPFGVVDDYGCGCW